MSDDDEADPELLALLAQSLGLGPKIEAAPSTGVLGSVEYVYDNALDVSISSTGSKAAAALLYQQLQQRQYSTYDWAKHELHPNPSGGEATVNFIFTMNLLNFSFWSDLPEDERFAIEHNDKRWTGYWSLVAALQRGLDEGYSITTPSSWSTLTDDEYAHIFRSATSEPMPLLYERISLLRTASHIEPTTLLQKANHSAARLVNLLTSTLPNHFSDTATYSSRTISFHKRAQILVADLWACFRGQSHGEFTDIDTALTMFADYRIPQMLQRLGVLWYSPRLEGKIRRKEIFEPREKLEVEVRGCSVWAVEMLRREIVKLGGGSWEAEVEDDSENENDVSVGETHAEPPGDVDFHVALEKHPPNIAGQDVAHVHQGRPSPDHHAKTDAPQDPNSATDEPANAEAAEAADNQTLPGRSETGMTTKAKRTKTVTVKLNAVLLDYLLYDTAKELEAREQREAQERQQQQQQQQQQQEDAINGQETRAFGRSRRRGGGGNGAFEPDGPQTLPHHRCRSIWY